MQSDDVLDLCELGRCEIIRRRDLEVGRHQRPASLPTTFVMFWISERKDDRSHTHAIHKKKNNSRRHDERILVE